MAEFQLSGFLPDFIHGEIHNPAESVLLLVKVVGAKRAQLIAQYAGSFLGRALLPGGENSAPALCGTMTRKS